MSTLNVNNIDKESGSTLTIGGSGTTVNVSNMVPDVALSNRNRIINGDMRIDQRNAGASVSNAVGDTYFIDRWHMFGAGASKMTGQQSTVAPTGFTNSALLTSSAATTPSSGDAYGFRQKIEGFNFADFNYGSAQAVTFTISFWVRSSISGTYSFACFNNANNRSYIATYSISAPNTWEYKTITIAGDTSGTWLKDNGLGQQCWWDLGSGTGYNGTAGSWNSGLDVRTSGSVNWIGTAGATFYITGVQLEVGSVATPFEHESYGQTLAKCQRYYQKTASLFYGTPGSGSLVGYVNWDFKVSMRASPTITGGNGTWQNITPEFGNMYASTGTYPQINSGSTADAEL